MCVILTKLLPSYWMTVCGSFRRGAPYSGDVDILLTHEDHRSSAFGKKGTDARQKDNYLKEVVDALKEEDIITDTISLGKTRFSGVCLAGNKSEKGVHRRLDLRLLFNEQYYCGVLYFTGSDGFNRSMRKQARDKGYKLSEYSLKKTTGSEETVPISSERDVFEAIDFPYKKPSDRNK